MSWKPPDIQRYVATDLIIETPEGIVLIERKFPPYGIALPGGMLEPELTAEENAEKEGNEETGLEVRLKDTRPLCVRSKPNRDPRMPVVSIAYIAQADAAPQPGEHDDAKHAFVLPYNQIPNAISSQEFAFDTKEILEIYWRHRNA